MMSFKKNRNYEEKEIFDMIYSIKNEMDLVHRSLDFTTDDMLIDSLIYELKALHKKYEYYLKICKKNGFIADGFGKIS